MNNTTDTKIEAGQRWVGKTNKIIFTITKVTEKSVSLTYLAQFDSDDYVKQKKGIISKLHLLAHMDLEGANG